MTLAWAQTPAQARVLLTQDQALAIAFPGARVERRTVFLTKEQMARIEKKAKAKVADEMFAYYVARSTDGILGYAFFESHIVRTMPETFMVALNPGGDIRVVELLAFYEPEDYKPHPKWLRTFKGRELSDQLWVKRGLRNIAGATLTAQAIAEGVRRILAVYEVAVKQ
ncbi:MAG: FMN-binding protein [Elusimicrobia bacterium]|nr:FMN-binding protein [Elusimicrobiota bacterium]